MTVNIPPTTHQHGADAYRLSSYYGMGEREAMAELLRQLIGNLYAARDAHAARRLDQMSQHNTRTLHILVLLRDTIAESDAWHTPAAALPARHMHDCYHRVFMRLANILRHPDIQAEYNALADQLKPLYRAWQPPPAE